MSDYVNHVALALLSGIVIEILYAMGVIDIGRGEKLSAGCLSAVWGLAFLVGVNESFKSWIAAGAWCIGLGIGAVVGVWIKHRKDDRAA